MADTRELILARLLAILTPNVTRIARNVDQLSGAVGSAAILSDGDEMQLDEPVRRNSRGDPRVLGDFMSMTPNITLIVGGQSSDVGSSLNSLRATVVPLIINDTTLIGLVGPNGEIRYTGLTLETQSGENREGRMTLDFKFQYYLSILTLGS